MPKKILVVDDSEVVRKLVEFQLTQAGYTVIMAENGREGVKQARKHEPDAIIMDVEMPEMDGFEASRLIRQVHATMHTPIIMLTSLSNIASMQAGYDAGVDDYLTKPFQPNELQLRVGAVLKRMERVQESVQEHETSTLAVFSLRGGAGSTSLATNIALGLTKLWERPATLVDLASPVGACDILLDAVSDNNLSAILKHDQYTIDDELIRDYITILDNGLYFLAGLRNPIDAELLNENIVSLIIDTVTQDTFYTVIDLPHNFGASTLAAIDRADHIIMPITPDIIALRMAKISLQILESLGFDDSKVHIVVNWTTSSSGIEREQIEKYLKHKILVTIPYVPGIWNEAINFGRPLISNDHEHPLTGLLEDLCWRFSTVTDRSRKDDTHNEMWERIAQRRAKRYAEQDKTQSKRPSTKNKKNP
jgi:pilus assembly protein CpaE